MSKGGKILLIGLGKQGRAALWDLVRSEVVEEVIATDISSEAEEYVRSLKSSKVTFVRSDIRDEDRLSELMRDVDLVVDLAPGQFAFSIAKLAVMNGKHLVNAMYLIDPTSVTDPDRYRKLKEEVKRLDELAREKNITVLPEFGLDPGIDLVLTGQAVKELDEIHELYTYGAGIPEPKAAATNPLKYKVTWSFDGVLRSYKRPARVIRDGRVEVVPPNEIFSPENCHEVEIEGIGILDAYPNGDVVEYAERFGLLKTLRFAARYSMRWSGHCQFWKKLVDLRFLDDTPIKVGNVTVTPREFLVALLEPQLRLRDDERDIAIVRVDARGVKNSKRMRVVYQLIDYRDLSTGFTAMQRTTGFTVSIGAQMILRGDISKKGIIFPGTDIPFKVFKAELEKRGMKIERFVEELTT
jgi:saccharopine dehydrogenase-like NADP-dependent oxidoreductase